MTSIKYCEMCFNARVCQVICSELEEECDLNDKNDLSYEPIGKTNEGYSMHLASGCGIPLRMIVQKWDETRMENVTVGAYYPKYCPNCGREITEYGG